MHKPFESLAPAKQTNLARELIAGMTRLNRSGDATLVVPSEYVEIVVVRSWGAADCKVMVRPIETLLSVRAG